MKAWQVHHYGEPDEMSFDDIPVPKPASGQVVIRNHAAGINFFDILVIQGKYQAKPEFPFTPGGEAAGEVHAIGEGITHVAPGDRVLAHTPAGYAEYSTADAARVSKIPAAMSFEQAAGFSVVYQTSWFALDHRGSLAPGEWLLVHAGASGVGLSAIQIGKAKGARVIATAGSEEKLEFCRAQGAEAAINYRDESWVEEVKRLTGRGADVIYDPVGGDIFDLSTKCVAPDGRILVVGFASGRIPSLTVNRALLKNMSVVGVFWGRHAAERPEYFQQTHEALSELYGQGKIHPPEPQSYPLSEAPKALGDLAGRKIAGKAVLKIES